MAAARLNGGLRERSRRNLASIWIGCAALYLVLDRTAAWTGSLRGEAGGVVALATILAALVVERLLFGRRPVEALRALGFGRPTAKAIGVAILISGLLLLYFPVFARATGASLSLSPGWLTHVPGLFAQAGIAEELVFRAFLFGHLFAGRSFWRAALLSLPPFVAVHLLLFTTQPAPVALAATLLSVASLFPLARLFVLGGNTLWAPAIVHFVIQGAIKVVVAPPPSATAMAVGWMAVCLVLPWLAFAFPTPKRRAAGG